jgi:hypothetical protein
VPFECEGGGVRFARYVCFRELEYRFEWFTIPQHFEFVNACLEAAGVVAARAWIIHAQRRTHHSWLSELE